MNSPAISRFHNWLESPTHALSLILAIAAVPRLFLIYTRTILIWPDSIGYYRSAAEMLQTHNLISNEIFHSPLYPIFLAVFLSFGHSPAVGFAVVITQHLLGLLTVVCCYYIARAVFNPVVAFYSSLLFGLHTLFLYYECVIQTELLFSFLLTLTLLLGLRALRNGSVWTYLLVGIFCGLAALTKPVAQQCLVCFLAGAFLYFRDFRRSIRVSFMVVLSYLSVVTPWMYLNLKAYGFWGLSHGEGLNLILRTIDLDHLQPAENSHYPQMKSLYKRLSANEQKTVYRMNAELKHTYHYSPLEADKLMFAFARETLFAHPAEYIHDSAIDFFYFFTHAKKSARLCAPRVGSFGCVGEHRTPLEFASERVMPGRELDPFVKRMFRSGDLVNRWVVLLSVVGGVFYFVRKHEPGGWQRDTAFGALLVLIVLYFAAVTVAFDTPQDRFRLPVDPMLLMFGVYGARELLALARKQIALRRLGLGRTALDPTQDSPPTQR